jgi:hypothetical protein
MLQTVLLTCASTMLLNLLTSSLLAETLRKLRNDTDAKSLDGADLVPGVP